MKKNLTRKELLLMSGTLFSMHFGSSCLLYPVTWGKEAGCTVIWVYLGVFLSGILLPFLGYLALAKGKGNFLELTVRVAPRGGRLLVLATILLLGPIYVVPRMTAAAWAAIAELLGMRLSGSFWPLIFQILFYPSMFWFAANEGKIIKRVGSILFPVLLCIVGGVIGKGLIEPISTHWTSPEFPGNAILYGISEGYATGDLPCALLFGLVLVESIRQAGVSEERTNRNLLCVSSLGLGLLALVHLGHMLTGANLGGTVPLTLSALYTRMVLLEWGPLGGVLFTVVLAVATLTSSIGCISSTSRIGVQLMHDKVPYHKVCAAFCVIGCLISCAGLNGIVTFLGPLLNACYPPAIVLALYYALMPSGSIKTNYFWLRFMLCTATVFSILEPIHVYIGLFHVEVPAFEALYEWFPLSREGFAWVPPVALLLILSLFSVKRK